MEALLQWGLDIIRMIQSLSNPPLTGIMRIITVFGSVQFCIVLLLLIYWCIDEKKGLRLGLALLVSAWINISLKFLLDQPRPFFAAYDPSLGMFPEKLGGLPSGHAQNTLVTWIIIASWVKKKWAAAGAVLICLLISFSRIYLGVHFPTDILGGWIAGGVVLCAYFFLGRRIEALLARGGPRVEMIAAAVASYIMILYRPGAESVIPGAVLLGMAAGWNLNKRYIGFNSSGVFGRTGILKYLTLLFRFFLGVGGGILIFTIFDKLSPDSRFTGRSSLFGAASDYFLLIYFFRYVITAVWMYAGAPWLFSLLRLSESHSSELKEDI